MIDDLPAPGCSAAEAFTWLRDRLAAIETGSATALTGDDLQDLLARLDTSGATDAPGSLFYSGRAPYNANLTANSLYRATGEQLAIINESPFAEFITSSRFAAVYEFLNPGVQFNWENETAKAFNDAAWGAASQRYADSVSGAVVVVLPDGALPENVFGSVELPALLANERVETINGVSRQSLAQAYDVYRQHALDSGATAAEALAAASEALVEDHVKPSSDALIRALGGMDADGELLLAGVPAPGSSGHVEYPGLTFTTPHAGLAAVGVALDTPPPSGLTLGEALAELAALGETVTADDLRDLAGRTSTGLEVDPDSRTVTLGERTYTVDPDGTVHLLDAAAAADAGRVVTVGDTTVGRLVASAQYRSALERVFGSADSPEALEFLGYRRTGSTAAAGVLDAVDSQIVRSHAGDLGFVTTDTLGSNALTSAMLDEALRNPLIDRVNGIRTSVVEAITSTRAAGSSPGTGGLTGSALTGAGVDDFVRNVYIASGQQHPEVTLSQAVAGSHALTNAGSLLGSAAVLHGIGVLGDLIDYSMLAARVADRMSDGDYAGAAAAVRSWSAGAAAGIVGSMAALGMAALLLGTGPVGAAAFILALAGGSAGSIIFGETFDGLLRGLSDWVAALLGLDDADGLPEWLDPSSAFDRPPGLFDPLVVDLDGDGVELISLAESTAQFDLNGDGLAERTAWVGPDDALLARDLDGNGTIDDVSELFGSQDLDGFTELRELDSNGDGRIDAADEAFDTLRLWRDRNGDGLTDADEVSTLAELGVSGIDLAARQVSEWTDGTWTSLRGTLTRTDGTVADVDEVWFATDQMRTTARTTGTADSTGSTSLPRLAGYGTVPDLRTAVSQDPGLHVALTDLVLESLTATPAEIRSALERFVLTWAGTDDVVAGSRGTQVDAQHLAFLEAVNGHAWLPGVPAASPSTVAQGTGVERYYQTVMASFVSKLAVQLPLSAALLTGDTTAADRHPLADLTVFVYSDTIDRILPVPSDAVTHLIANLGAGAAGVQQVIETRTLFEQFHLTAPDGGPLSSSLPAMLRAVGGTEAQATMLQLLLDGAALSAPTSPSDRSLTGTTGSDILLGSDRAEVITGRGGADLFDGGAGDDWLTGSSGDDVYVWRHGSGHDTFADTGGLDRLLLDGVLPEQVTVRSDAWDTIQVVIAESAPGVGDGGSVTLARGGDVSSVEQVWLADGTVWGTDDLQRLATVGTERAEEIHGFDRAVPDEFRGGAGADVLYGHGGVNTYYWERGDGDDLIIDGEGVGYVCYPAEQGFGTLVLSGVQSSQVTVVRAVPTDAERTSWLETADLVIAESYPGAGDGAVIRLDGTFADDDLPSDGIDAVVLDDVTWSRDDLRSQYLAAAGSGSDTITGFVGRADVFRGGPGDDLLVGLSGPNTFVWSHGDGNDTVQDLEGHGTGTLVLDGVREAQVHIDRHEYDVLLTVAESAPGAGDGGLLTLSSTFLDPGVSGLGRVVLADASWDLETLRERYLTAGEPTAGTIVGFTDRDDTIRGGAGDDLLIGNGGRNRFVWAPGDGNDTIADHTWRSTTDTLVLEGVPSDRVTLAADGEDVLLTIADSRPGTGDGATLRLSRVLVADGRWGEDLGIDEVVLADTTWSRDRMVELCVRPDPAPGVEDVPVGENVCVIDIRQIGCVIVVNDEGRFDTLVLTGVSSDRVRLDPDSWDRLVTLVIDPSMVGMNDGGSIQVISRGDAPGTLGGLTSVVLADTVWWYGEPAATDAPAQADPDGAGVDPDVALDDDRDAAGVVDGTPEHSVPVAPDEPAASTGTAEPAARPAAVEPAEPAEPVDAVVQADPVEPAVPAVPADPVAQADPVEPVHPVEPVEPAVPADPIGSAVSGVEGHDLAAAVLATEWQGVSAFELDDDVALLALAPTAFAYADHRYS
ncbi:MAG TPA: hypothetical protein VGC67_04500 [Cellulomonas sp.]